MKIYTYTVITIIFLYFNFISCNENIKCNGTILYDHHNVTEFDRKFDSLDIFWGEEINLKCQLDDISLENGCNATNLSYDFGVRDNPPENTSIQLVNDKVLQLKINTNQMMAFTVTCLYNGNGLNSMVLTIKVGLEPQPIEMQCLMYSYQILQCEFAMSGNPVSEQYEIMYSNHSTQPAVYERVEFESKEIKWEWYLQLPAHKHFSPFGQFTFLVLGTNRFGERIQPITFQTKEIVVIPKPLSTEIRDIKLQSVSVKICFPLTIKMYEFIYNVSGCMAPCYYENRWFERNVFEIISDTNKTVFSLTLNVSLPHACQRCKLKINIQLKNALFPAKQQITVETKFFSYIRPPSGYVPITFTNGFEFRNDDDVIVYWKEFAQQNDVERNYKMPDIYENGKMLSTVNWTVLSNSAGRLRNLDRNKSYTIRFGTQMNPNVTIQIPKEIDLVPPPDYMRKTRFHDVYELSWKPSTSHHIVNYTIYWCSPLDELESMCGTLLGHKILPNEVTSFQYENTPKSGMKSFAIAANTNSSSSGLVWFICPPKHNVPVVTYRTHSYLILNWTMPCHTNRKSHLLISYCVSDLYTRTSCGTNKNVITSATLEQESIVLPKLQQCTPYLIRIQNFPEKSSPTIYINERTTEGQPPIPNHLKIGNITNTTVEISWSIPNECPGLKSYRIYVDPLKDPIIFPNTDLKTYKIGNLSSFSGYHIKLALCYKPTQCSELSESLYVKTKFGIPGGINKLIITAGENDFTYFSWQSTVQNANFQYYEVKHIFTQDNIDSELTSIVSNPKCTLTKKLCDGAITNYKFDVRVINIDQMINVSYDVQMNATFKPNVCFEEIAYSIKDICPNEECLAGKWGRYRDFYCYPKSIVMKFCVLLVITLAIGFGLSVGTIVGIRKYRSIKNVGHVSMPEGLNNIFRTSSTSSNLNQKCEPTPINNCADVANEEYCSYDYILLSADRLDRTSETNSIATTLENQNDYLEYSFDVVPLPNPGNYVKLNDLQKIPTSGYTSISALQTQTQSVSNDEIELFSLQYKIRNQNLSCLPVANISTMATSTTVNNLNGYLPIQMLQTIKPQTANTSNGYTPVSALFSTNGYISITTLQNQTS